MGARAGQSSHKSARDLLADKNVSIQFQEVDVSGIATQRDARHALLVAEQDVMNDAKSNPQQPGSKNKQPALGSEKHERYRSENPPKLKGGIQSC
jgi:hypothetical protein